MQLMFRNCTVPVIIMFTFFHSGLPAGCNLLFLPGIWMVSRTGLEMYIP